MTSTGLVIENVTVLRVKACYVMLKLLRHLPTQGQVYVAACAMRGIASVCVCVCVRVSASVEKREREKESKKGTDVQEEHTQVYTTQLSHL